jgi:hypothetical protein
MPGTLAVTLTTVTLTTAAVTATPAAPVAIAETGAYARTRSCSQSFLPLPDPSCQPGAVNPDVTQETIGSTICVPRWTSTVRPPTSYTNALKVRQIGEYGYADTRTADYEEDHLVPLELGGAPHDPRNLWPEPRYEAGGRTAGDKDSVENALRKKVCAGVLTLAAARDIMATDWRQGLGPAVTRRGSGGSPRETGSRRVHSPAGPGSEDRSCAGVIRPGASPSRAIRFAVRRSSSFTGVATPCSRPSSTISPLR